MGKYTFESLAGMKPKQLDEILRASKAPAMDSLAGWEFRGWNVVSAIAKPYVSLTGIQRFAKGFYVKQGAKPPSEGGELYGYNVEIQRGGIDEEWLAKPSPEAPSRRFFYRVYAAGEGPRPIVGYDDALFLDYTARKDRNGLFEGGPLFGDGGLKDFLVQPDAENPDLLLGKAVYRLPPLNVDAGVFVAQRWRQFDYQEA